jgi:hypothetical protein
VKRNGYSTSTGSDGRNGRRQPFTARVTQAASSGAARPCPPVSARSAISPHVPMVNRTTTRPRSEASRFSARS